MSKTKKPSRPPMAEKKPRTRPQNPLAKASDELDERLRCAGYNVEKRTASAPNETKVTFVPARAQIRPVWDNPIAKKVDQTLLDLMDEDIAREKERRERRATYPPPYMFEVIPKIFVLRLDRLYPRTTDQSMIEARARSAARTVSSSLATAGATIYEDRNGGEPWFFGFPHAPWIEALNKATEVLVGCRNALSGLFAPQISVSTYGVRDFKDVLSAPWSFIGVERLNEALHCRVQFNPLEQHIRRFARDA